MIDRGARRSGVPAAAVGALRSIPHVGDLLAGTARRLRSIRFVGLVAEVAFFTAFGLVPLAVAVLALVGLAAPLLGEAAVDAVGDRLLRAAVATFARDLAAVAQTALDRLLGGGGGLLALPLGLTLLLSARGFTGAMRGLAHIYGHEERRSPLRDAVATVAFTAAAAVLGVIAVVGALLGPLQAGTAAWSWLRWIVVPAGLLLWHVALYRYVGGGAGRLRDDLAGAVVATAGMVASGMVYVAVVRSRPTLLLGPFLGPVLSTALATFSLLFALAAFVLVGGALNAERAGAPPSVE